MSVKFLNQNITVNTVRPTGFKFPVGLSGKDRLLVDYLVVAGGGSGGGNSQNNVGSGGGGAGGFRTGSDFIVSVYESASVTVGAGGTEIGIAHV